MAIVTPSLSSTVISLSGTRSTWGIMVWVSIFGSSAVMTVILMSGWQTIIVIKSVRIYKFDGASCVGIGRVSRIPASLKLFLCKATALIHYRVNLIWSRNRKPRSEFYCNYAPGWYDVQFAHIPSDAGWDRTILVKNERVFWRTTLRRRFWPHSPQVLLVVCPILA